MYQQKALSDGNPERAATKQKTRIMLHQNTANSNYSGSANGLENDRGSGRHTSIDTSIDLSELSWNDLRAYAKSLGISTYQKKRTEIEAEITEALASKYGYSEGDNDAIKALKRLGFREVESNHIDNEFPAEYRGKWMGVKFYSDAPGSLQAIKDGQGWELNLKNCDWDFGCWKRLFLQSLETGEAPSPEEINGIFFWEFSDEEIATACDRFTTAKTESLNRDGQILNLILDYARFGISPEWLKHQLNDEKDELNKIGFKIIENATNIINKAKTVADFDDLLTIIPKMVLKLEEILIQKHKMIAKLEESLQEYIELKDDRQKLEDDYQKLEGQIYDLEHDIKLLKKQIRLAESAITSPIPDTLSDEWFEKFVGEPPTALAPEPSDEPEESEEENSLLSESNGLTTLATDKTEDMINQLSAEGQGIDSLIRKLRIEKYFDADEQKAAILQQTIDELEAQAQAIQEKIEALYPQFDFEDEKFNLSWRDISSEIERTAPFKKSEHEWVNDKGVSGIITTKHYCISRSQFPSLRPAQLGDRLGIEYGQLKGFAYHCAGKTDGQRFDNSFTEKNIYEFQVERPERGNNWMIEISKWSPTSSDPSPSPKVVPLQPQPATCPSPQRRTRLRPTPPPYKPAARKPDVSISGKGKFWLTKESESVMGDRTEYQIVREKPDGGWSTHRLISHPHGISCDCKGFLYRGYCCHLKALSEILKPEMEVFEERSYLLEIIRINKFWDLLDLVKPSILNQTVAEVAEGNKALKSALALREVRIT